ncbi:MAG: tetratricopeptide repeat protein [Chloroflexi bacterium]|nr:tetratricopeptide repeat protein [Chloroflexota bacterium]
MLKRMQIFLGPRNFRAFVALLAITGLASLALNVLADSSSRIPALQTLLLLVFIVGAAGLVLARLPSEERKRWLAVILPSLLVMAVGSLAAPHVAGVFLGAGLGWMVAGIFIFRNTGGPRSYKAAVKAMRKRDYATAVAEMTAQIKTEPARAEHYRFRAELHRLSGNLKAARRDYTRMTELDADSAVAWNGLAEVELQAGRFDAARKAAQTACKLAPEEWVAANNLGMIEDRLSNYEAVARHLSRALELKIPDSRHRLLAHLYLNRAYQGMGMRDAAERALAALRSEKAGLEEWQVIMSADEAKTLRDVLEDDIELARRLIEGEPVDAAVE